MKYKGLEHYSRKKQQKEENIRTMAEKLKIENIEDNQEIL